MMLPKGAEGTKSTLKLMVQLTRTGKTKMPVRLLAMRLTRNLPAKNWVQEVKAIHAYVKDNNNIRYIKDVRGVETLQTPEKTLELRQGDCDDKSVLVASLLESIGHPTRFLAVGFFGKNFSHVLVETKIGSRWVAVETTEDVPLGWTPPKVVNTLRMHN